MRRKNQMNWSKEPDVHLDIEKVEISRAIYMGAVETPRVRIVMTTTDNQRVDFELSADLTRELIEKATATYFIINPPLRNSRGAFGA